MLLEDYWRGMMCVIVWGIQKGLAVYKPNLSGRKGNESSLIQMSHALGEVGGSRSQGPASY